MSEIGTPYDYVNYNCAHAVADWYKEHFNLELDCSNTFSIAFIKMLRSQFQWVLLPQHGDLAVMKMREGSLHVGIYDNGYIRHNYFEPDGGQIVLTDPSILTEFTRDGIKYVRHNSKIL